MRERRRERGLFVQKNERGTKKKAENSLLELLVSFKTTSFWLSENLSPACADDRSSETCQTTCRFRIIQTTGRLSHANDTPYASTRNDCAPMPNDTPFHPMYERQVVCSPFSRFLFFNF